MKKLLIAIIMFGAFMQTDVQAQGIKYKRSTWRHWIDADKDCQNTRQEVLIDESLIPVTMDSKNCKVTKGRWFCPYTGKFFTDPKQLDVDHLIPLKHAHISGGDKWRKDRKKEYANFMDDPRYLIAVYKGANRSKGAKAPHEWMPKFKPYWCSYLVDWVYGKYEWNLTSSTAEKQFIEKTLTEQKCFQ